MVISKLGNHLDLPDDIKTSDQAELYLGKKTCTWTLDSVHNSDRVFVTRCGQQFYVAAGAELETCPECKKKIKEVSNDISE